MNRTIDPMTTVLLNKIVERAWTFDAIRTAYGDKIKLLLDLEHVHRNLRLPEMLEGRDLDFVHDIAGIRRHLNRLTGKFEDCFCPRFSL